MRQLEAAGAQDMGRVLWARSWGRVLGLLVGMLLYLGFSGVTGADAGAFSVPMAIDCSAPPSPGRDIRIDASFASSNAAANQYVGIENFDWTTLAAGDTVRIFYNAKPYAGKILIRSQGTAQKHIRVCGVAGPQGQLPVISGKDAKTYPGLFGAAGPETNNIEDLGILLIFNNQNRPAYIDIEGLNIRDAIDPNWTQSSSGTPGYGFTTGTGVPYVFHSFVACIRVQNGDHITIRGNELSNCSIGVFANAQLPEARMVRDLLLEGNYIYANGLIGNGSVHGVYLEVAGILVQFNYFGDNKPGAWGSVYKGRNSGEVIRYNYFGNGARSLDLVEPQAANVYTFQSLFNECLNQKIAPAVSVSNPPGSVSEYPYCAMTYPRDFYQGQDGVIGPYVAADDAAYRQAYVYGNIFNNDCSKSVDCSVNMIHWGADNTTEDSRRHLWFYNNTISIKASPWGYPDATSPPMDHYQINLFDMGDYIEAYWDGTFGRMRGYIQNPDDFPKVDAINNTVYLGAPAGISSNAGFSWTRYLPDQLVLGKNWISSGWNDHPTGVNGFPSFAYPITDGVALAHYPNPGNVFASGLASANSNPHVSGVANLITGAPPAVGSYPAPFNTDFTTQVGSPLLGIAQSLPADLANYPVEFQIAVSGTGKLLVTPRAAVTKIGAYESATQGGAPSPIATFSTGSLSFPSQTIGVAAASQMVTLSNTGTAVLPITSITADGDFSQSNSCGTSLAASANCTITVGFTPIAAGSRTGILTITDSLGSQTVGLFGSGAAASSGYGASLSPQSLSFASQAQGSSSAALSLSLSNTGTAALPISQLTASGDFSQSNTCGTSLALAGSCSISVIFSPSAIGSRSGSLTVTDGAGTQTVSLSGTGVAVAAGVTANLVDGWNLIGNSTSGTVDVAAAFGDPAKVNTVWKWRAGSQGGWAFYTPSVADGGAAYAGSKGYTALAGINAGEGFWVNARTAFSVVLGSGSPVDTAHFADGIAGNGLAGGWSLIAVGGSPTSRRFTNGIALQPPATGNLAATSLLSLWAWYPGSGAVSPGWYFYAPDLDNARSLGRYIIDKGYLDFDLSGKTLEPATGFWVNHP